MAVQDQYHPSRARCLELLEDHNTPTHVIKHCIAVADTAVKLGYALNQHGYQMNLPMLQAACLLHDIARTQENHWEEGSRIALEHGYDQEAELIKRHMFHACDAKTFQINEQDILCLSDRMTKEDQYVGLQERMKSILERFHGNPEVEERIGRHLQDNRYLKHHIEDLIQETVEELLNKSLPDDILHELI